MTVALAPGGLILGIGTDLCNIERVEKTLARDLLPDLKAATNGFVVDKVEGFTIDSEGSAFVVTDNDGVDDSSGETLFLRLGTIAAVN